MREILFRAKRLGDGGWIEGFYGKYLDVRNHEKYRHFIIVPELNCRNLVAYFNDIEIDPKTACQYTGLNDMYNNKIFGGDIVKCANGEHGLIKHGKYYDDEKSENIDGYDSYIDGFDEYGFYVEIKLDENDFYRFSIGTCEEWAEIIGNIFDNPELFVEVK